MCRRKDVIKRCFSVYVCGCFLFFFCLWWEVTNWVLQPLTTALFGALLNWSLIMPWRCKALPALHAARHSGRYRRLVDCTCASVCVYLEVLAYHHGLYPINDLFMTNHESDSCVRVCMYIESPGTQQRTSGLYKHSHPGVCMNDCWADSASLQRKDGGNKSCEGEGQRRNVKQEKGK